MWGRKKVSSFLLVFAPYHLECTELTGERSAEERLKTEKVDEEKAFGYSRCRRRFNEAGS
ncbi:MAG: hypothetical protein J6X34_06400 [Clostridia bacterium]|nr:hypothetical protein [Clostridia bacterium]